MLNNAKIIIGKKKLQKLMKKQNNFNNYLAKNYNC